MTGYPGVRGWCLDPAVVAGLRAEMCEARVLVGPVSYRRAEHQGRGAQARPGTRKDVWAYPMF